MHKNQLNSNPTMNHFRQAALERLLNFLSECLDISPTQYNAIVSSYTAVGEYLAGQNSPICEFEPIIRSQGSFLLGTCIKPINEIDDIDIDLVISLAFKNENWTQSDLKNVIGDYLKISTRYGKLLDKEGRRCWTILYRENSDNNIRYHLDILPSIVGKEFEARLFQTLNTNLGELAINYTDNLLSNYKNQTNLNFWPLTNPFGFAKWFYSRATNTNEEQYNWLKLSVQQVPNYQGNKLILQKIIQLLKRHRDVMFNGDEEKPISIIITTLAAKAYRNETDLIDGIRNVITSMSQYIESINPITGESEDYIGNPVNPKENFADKWKENRYKKEKFYEWITRINYDFNEIFNTEGLDNYTRVLGRSFGQKLSNETIKKFGEDQRLAREMGNGKYDNTYGLTFKGAKKYDNHSFFGKE